MGKIIAFTNQKGGVGKTTSAVNVAASLGILGYEVLIVDLDPQGNATSGLGVIKHDLKLSVQDLLTNPDVKAETVIQKTKFKKLSIIPTKTSLAGIEYDLGDMENGECILKSKLESVKDNFDYIIIDCPPSLSLLTVNALVCADGAVIPMQCEFFSLEGLSQLHHTINGVKANYNNALHVVGIVITMYNGRVVLTEQVMAELRRHYSDKLFETTVSRSVKLAEAPGFGKPVYYHARSSKGAIEYMNVAKELAERI